MSLARKGWMFRVVFSSALILAMLDPTLGMAFQTTTNPPEWTILVTRTAPHTYTVDGANYGETIQVNVPCYFGSMWVEDKHGRTVARFLTLEPDGLKAIPSGDYSAHLRYDKADKWRIQLDDVLGFKGIQIHIGNVPADTKGCILIGKGRRRTKVGTADWLLDHCTLTESAQAYAELKRAFYGTDQPVSTPNVRITVKVR